MPTRILEKHPDECFLIPMPSNAVRSLNLATAVGIVLYEGLRQLTAADRPRRAGSSWPGPRAPLHSRAGPPTDS
jgi:hypothetical protein